MKFTFLAFSLMLGSTQGGHRRPKPDTGVQVLVAAQERIREPLERFCKAR